MNWIKFNQVSAQEIIVDLRSEYDANISAVVAAEQTILHIIKNYPSPYTLMLSGGVDSQAMLGAWIRSGVEFDTRSVRYANGLNDHDLVELQIYAEKHNISINFVELDVLHFLEYEYDEWANTYDCSSPQICTHMKMIQGVAGTVIFSGNFIEPNIAFINYVTMGICRYAEKTGQSVVPFFFMETAQLAQAFIPTLLKLNDKVDINGYERKCLAYINAGFDVVRQPQKYSGFEQIKDVYDITHGNRITVQAKLKFANKSSSRTFDRLLRYPYEELLGNQIYKFVTNWTAQSTLPNE